MFRRQLIRLLVVYVFCVVRIAAADDSPSPNARQFAAADSLDISQEPSDDARDCLAGLAWETGPFTVDLEDDHPERADALVRFPSPVASGNDRNDRVAMEWYFARSEAGAGGRMPAVVVVHESGSSMGAGRFVAQGLRRRGVHTLLLHLPYYGERRTGRSRPTDVDLVTVMRQAVGDVRRARDAAAVLPGVDIQHIGLLGISLGGFVSATVAGLDDGYDSTFLLLAGGDLYDLIQTGKKDTAKVRAELEKAGLTDDKLRSLTQLIEPTRLGHRINRNATWLYSGEFDSVVPIRHALILAESAGLDAVHHIRMPANHYSGAVLLPLVMDHIDGKIRMLRERRQ